LKKCKTRILEHWFDACTFSVKLTTAVKIKLENAKIYMPKITSKNI